MVKRYFTSAYWSEDLQEECQEITHAYTIHEPDPEPYHTGILDKHGNSIMAQQSLSPIGFVRHR